MKRSANETEKNKNFLPQRLETLETNEKRTLFKYQNLSSQMYYWYQLSLDSFSPFYEPYELYRDEAMQFMYGQEEAIRMFNVLQTLKEKLKKVSFFDKNLLKNPDPKNLTWRNACRTAIEAATHLTATQKISIESDLNSLDEIVDNLNSTKKKKTPILYRSPQDFIKKLQRDANKPSMMDSLNLIEIISPENFAEDIETYVVIGSDGNVDPALVKHNPHYKQFPGKQGKVAYFFYGSTGETPYSSEVRKSLMGSAIFDPNTTNLDVAFRGSRSGAIRATESLKGEGNPDWATDLAFEGIHEAKICPKGKICYGFAKAYLTVEKSLAAICLDAGKRTLRQAKTKGSSSMHSHRNSSGDPTSLKITTTGHSLGGAMATMFFLAMQEGKFSDTLTASLTADTSDVSGVSKAALRKQLQHACQTSHAVTFSSPPTSDAEQVAYLETRRNVTSNLKRAFIEDDIFTKKPSWLFLAFLRRVFKPKRSQKNAHRLSACEAIMPDHVRGQSISLGKYSSSSSPDVVVFLGSDGAPHTPDTNMKKIIASLQGETLTPYATYQYIDPDFEKFSTGGGTNFTPTAYANIVAHMLDYERELTLIVAQVFDQPSTPKGMAKRKVSAYRSEIDSVIQEITKGIQKHCPLEDQRHAFIPASGSLSPLEKLIPALISLEAKIKHTTDRAQYNALLQTFKQVSGMLRKVAIHYPEVPNLQAISGYTRTFSSIYAKSPHCLIEFTLHVDKFNVKEKKYFFFYDTLKALSQRYSLTQVCREYEALLEKYLIAKLNALNQDASPVKTAAAIAGTVHALEKAMTDFAAAVVVLEHNKVLVKIHAIVADFKQKATRWNGMALKAAQIEQALNKLSLDELGTLSYDALLDIPKYRALRDALSAQRFIFKGMFPSTQSMSRLAKMGQDSHRRALSENQSDMSEHIKKSSRSVSPKVTGNRRKASSNIFFRVSEGNNIPVKQSLLGCEKGVEDVADQFSEKKVSSQIQANASK